MSEATGPVDAAGPAGDDRAPCPESGTTAFHRRAGELFCEDVPVRSLAERFGTPLYVYSGSTIDARFAAVRAAFGADARICYAVKANSNLTLLRHLHRLGAGFDVVSGGELARLQAAGIPTTACVFAGVAKQRDEIEAAVAAGILLCNVESPHELPLLAAAGARHGKPVDVALRLNPDVDAGTHGYITTGRKDTKFGVDLDTAARLVPVIRQEPWLRLRGYHVHLGSQLRSPEPYLRAFERVAAFLDGDSMRHDGVEYLDLGGGFGIGYGQGPPLDLAELARQLLPRLRERGLRLLVEPGRFLVAEAGALVTTVLGAKDQGGARFLLVDAAMNDLLRPALYQAEHPMAPVGPCAGDPVAVDVVGPVCETADFLARNRRLPPLQPGALLAVFAAGAYGASMASNYNSRRRPAEVLVDGGAVTLIRRRESHPQLWQDEVELS